MSLEPDETAIDRATQAAEISRLTKIATRLTRELKAPPQYHSVFVHTAVSGGQFINTIRVSVRPDAEGLVTVPADFEGEKIERAEWPDAVA